MMTKWNVLCVDDVEENLYAYEVLLAKIDTIQVIKASSGPEALKHLLKEKIDLILLDIQMPGMDGYEVARLLKTTQRTQHIPIIFITAVFKQNEFIARGFELGAVDYLTKPLDDNLLLNRIRLYLELFGQKQQAESNLELFYSIAEGVGDGLYVINSKGTLDFINNAALRMLQYTHNELSGVAIHEKIHSFDAKGKRIPKEKCPICRLLGSHETQRFDENVLMRKDGELLPVMTVASSIKVTGENDTKIICLFRDISQELEYKQIQQRIFNAKDQMILMLVDAVDKRDPYTAGHSIRVARYCELIAREMGYSEQQIALIVTAGHLHDIGKISTPDSILLKPGRFDNDEYAIMKLHLQAGYDLLSHVKEYSDLAELMRYHHERYDGKGYPMGLATDAIPALARIMIVADAFDAMTTNRIYKKRQTVEMALHEIRENSGTQFHPEVVHAAIKALQSVIIDEYKDQTPHNDIEEKRFAYFYHDRVTGCYNVEYLSTILEYANIGINQRLYGYKVDIHNMSRFNNEQGWEKGDALLKKLCRLVIGAFDEKYVFRVSGDDFLVVTNKEKIIDVEEINRQIKIHADYLEISVTAYENIENKFEDLIR